MNADVRASTRRLLDAVGNVSLLADNCPVNILQGLASAPRQGKALRIDRFGLFIPKRSLLDHVESLAFQADLLAEFEIAAPDPDALAQCIAFHDLCEVITGDVPDFTGDELFPEAAARQKASNEQRANLLIAETLPSELSRQFRQTLQVLASGKSETARYFFMLDKTDPIVAIWRYMRGFREECLARPFLPAMDDFFRNPAPRRFCVGSDFSEFVGWLQDRANASAYLASDYEFYRALPKKTAALFDCLIETRSPLLCIP